MITQRLRQLPSYKQHIFSLLFSCLCMAAAVGISSVYYYITNEFSVNIALIFTFFLVLVSCYTVGCLYGIAYSLFAVLWLDFLYTYPFFRMDFTRYDFPVTFLCMTAVTVLISTLTSHLALQANLIVEREKQLADAEKEKMRANLLRAVSHDLRTPLTGILGNSAVFLENQEQLSEEQKKSIVTNIYDDSNWLINMVENLLTVTRIRDHDLSISTSEESIEEVIAEALQKMEKRHPGCVIRAKIPDEFILLPMDAVLIEQVTINLLENALLHSGSSDPIDLIVNDMGTEVAFTVRDYGVGIPGEKLKNLFDGMDCSGSNSADVHKGMGIGLMICKTIITAHHGTLTGGNHEHGAEFIFTLPKAKKEALSTERNSI